MASLFISHSSHDRDEAKRVAKRLQVEGFAALFLDFDPAYGIPAGRDWKRELFAQLRKADGLIFMASAASVDSQWCITEVGLAQSLGKPVFPLRLEAGVRLGPIDDVQWIDLSEGETALARLFVGLRRAGLDPADSFAWDPTRSPYPGLESFSGDDAAVFFGREDEIARLVELLQPTLQRGAGRFVAVVGPSGSGKSSLVRAGLLPRLERLNSRWVVLPALVPGQQPTRNLAYCVAAAFAARGQPQPVEEIAAVLRHGGAGLVDLAGELGELAGAAVPGGAANGRINVLVVIDQAEELLTRTGVREQQGFLNLLREALGDGSPVWVVATVRSEFLSTAPERAGLAEVVDDPLIIEPLSRARLPVVIQQPAQRAGLQFAPGLVEQMVEETTGGDALPLLAYMLRELYQQAGADGTVSVAEYEALGGVIGALQHRADRLTDELDRRGRGESVLPTLTKFAVVEGDAEPTSRRIPRSALGPDEQAVADAFVEARLLTSNVDADGKTVIGVAHEALLRQWRPLREGIEASRASLRMRSELERLAADWQEGGRDESYLLRGARLAEFNEWARMAANPRPYQELRPSERDFLQASRRAIRRRRIQGRAVLAAVISLIVALTAAGVIISKTSENAIRQRDAVVSRQLVARSQATATTDPRVARLQSLAAWRIEPSADARHAMLAAATLPGLAYLKRVGSVTFSADGAALNILAEDGRMHIWNVRTQEEIATAHVGPNGAEILALSPNGEVTAVAKDPKHVEIFDVKTRRRIGTLSTPQDVLSATFSPNGETLAIGGESGVQVWRRKNAHNIHFDDSGTFCEVALSYDDTTLASACSDQPVRLWDLTTQQLRGTLPKMPGDAGALAFSRDGNILAIGNAENGSIRLWNVRSGDRIGGALNGHIEEVVDLIFSRDGATLVSGGVDGTVRVWDVRVGAEIVALTGHLDTVYSLALSPDGTMVASASRDGVRVWGLQHWQRSRWSVRGSDMQVGAVFSPNNRILAVAALDGDIQLWDVARGQKLGHQMSAGGGTAEALAFSPDGRILASGTADGLVRLWDVGSQEARGQVRIADSKLYQLPSVAFISNGDLLATAYGSNIQLWNVQTLGAPLVTIHNPGSFSADSYSRTILAGSQDGKVLASGLDDVRLWSVATGQALGDPLADQPTNFTRVNSLAFSSDGSTLTSTRDDHTVTSWDARTGQQLELSSTGGTGPLLSVALSPDLKSFAEVSADNTIRLWDLATRRQIGPVLIGHTARVRSINFSPDGKFLATTSEDATIKLWDVSYLLDPVREICGSVGHSFTAEEWKQFIPAGPAYRDLCA